jgi:hypothetical protein
MSKIIWQCRINRAAAISDRDSPFRTNARIAHYTASEYGRLWALYLTVVR